MIYRLLAALLPFLFTLLGSLGVIRGGEYHGEFFDAYDFLFSNCASGETLLRAGVSFEIWDETVTREIVPTVRLWLCK